MKRALLILSLFAILLNTFSKAIIFLRFEANRDFIAQNLCVQKEKKDNCCKGSCLLKKQLSEDNERENQVPFHTNKDKSEITLFCENNSTVAFETSVSPTVFAIPSTFLLLIGESSVSHPPPQS